MTPEEISKELIAQNLDGDKQVNIKIIYIYKPKSNKNFTSCVIEVSPEVHRRLLASARIYLRFSACKFVDHIRVLQCYRCMSFGHMAKDCKSTPTCGHCSDSHETTDCKNKTQTPRCCNCIRLIKKTACDTEHSASDATKCPILGNKIKERITYINYG